MQLHPKNQKQVMLPFPIKLKKTNFGPIQDREILFQKFQNNDFVKIYFIQLLLHMFHAKKSEKIHCIHLLFNFRNSFWATFCPKKSSQSILSLYATVTSRQKIRKVPCIDFSQNLRTSFGTNSGHFNPLSTNLTKWSNTLKI